MHLFMLQCFVPIDSSNVEALLGELDSNSGSNGKANQVENLGAVAHEILYTSKVHMSSMATAAAESSSSCGCSR
jgi:hypothetical protein